ncbi:TetR/AcrR family transcriptional regulator C-terminal domain-containing protein [Streptomyces sp. B-S-A8]|uniref:TetR/AcrR family transcriptional regulator C-terminal domain-containing protein n=1 Tax=Streptomyces solicavernae TaxID=3043614 RepID=A0ABT6RPT6_9ACTN|nr:TetR/AcrR family transcriptional regulator C-terminal domain-containing protein [Streptomyces sp. B-S-A8]MDI3386229.1 TetR/AcrR family transcriptional regulator C-terminal domain-containing protein [Streptomyces sp. B-S-A8]
MGRPRKALLDRTRIGATALQLIDEKGDFTVPEVARRLGVQTASVYHHVDGRAGVVELIRDRVVDRLDPSTLDLRPWDAALEAWARTYRAAFAAHPRAISLLMTSPVRVPRVIGQYERVAGLLVDAGFAEDAVMPVITGLDNLVLGSALDLSAPEVMWIVEDESAAPRLAAAQRATGPARADRAFDLTLAGFLAYCREVRQAGGAL